MMIFFGQVGPLERLRMPLQTFVSTHVLGGRDATDSNINEAVDRLLLNMRRDIEETAVRLCFTFLFAWALTGRVRLN